MEYPYRKYIKYLVTMKKDTISIIEECLRLSLPSPEESYINILRAEVGNIPKSWEPSFNRKNEYFCRWLRKQGVLPFWRNDIDVKLSTNFLYRTAVRKDFETLSLSLPTIEEIRDVLLIKYEEKLVPTKDTLEAYCKYYWDLSLIGHTDLVSFLSVYHNKDANIASLKGDLSTSYAHSNIPEEVDSEFFYNNFISMVNQQVTIARREYSDQEMRGHTMMGLAALCRQASDAIDARKELRSSGRVEVLDTIKEQALAFRMRTVTGSDIITIDDIMKDEESEESLQNVHKLTIATK